MTRFYLQQKQDPHGPRISLFVGNLPTGLAQRQYEKILLDIIGPGMFLFIFSWDALKPVKLKSWPNLNKIGFQ
jgi:hypothetical protein